MLDIGVELMLMLMFAISIGGILVLVWNTDGSVMMLALCSQHEFRRISIPLVVCLFVCVCCVWEMIYS